MHSAFIFTYAAFLTFLSPPFSLSAFLHLFLSFHLSISRHGVDSHEDIRSDIHAAKFPGLWYLIGSILRSYLHAHTDIYVGINADKSPGLECQLGFIRP